MQSVFRPVREKYERQSDLALTSSGPFVLSYIGILLIALLAVPAGAGCIYVHKVNSVWHTSKVTRLSVNSLEERSAEPGDDARPSPSSPRPVRASWSVRDVAFPRVPGFLSSQRFRSPPLL